jgi:hypothetical protein
MLPAARAVLGLRPPPGGGFVGGAPIPEPGNLAPLGVALAGYRARRRQALR